MKEEAPQQRTSFPTRRLWQSLPALLYPPLQQKIRRRISARWEETTDYSTHIETISRTCTAVCRLLLLQFQL
jgi:hypothetical protein